MATKLEKSNSLGPTSSVDNKYRDDFFRFGSSKFWADLWSQNFAFLMICAYLLFEYMRPQSIIPGLDILPWMQIFLLLSAAGYAMQKEREPVARNYVLFWLLLFLAVILLSGFTAFIPEYSWRSLDAYYLWILIFFLITRIATTEKQLMLLILIICLASFKMSAYGAKAWTMRGFSFTSWGLKGPPGFFENSGEFAVQMLVFFGISMYLFFAFRHRISGWRYWFLLAAPITAGMSVMGASSRGSQIALAGLLYLIFLHGKISIRAVLLSAIIGYTAFSFLPEEQLARFQEIGEDKTSQQRMLYWENGWEMMQEFPVLGVGYYNFIPYFETYYPGDMLYPEAQLAHNIFVQVGADLGFVGLFVYLVLIFLGFSIPRKARRRLIEMGLEEDWRVYMSKGLALGFLGFLIAGQFVSIVYYPFMYIHLALVCVLLNSVESTRREMERASGNHSERVPATEELPVA